MRLDIINKPVINKDTSRFGYRPEGIVIHIAEGYLNGAYSWFNNRSSFASSHYMIGKSGEIWQFVHPDDTAWHAGVSMNPTWQNLKHNVNPNFYTIGIEHEGFTGEKWTASMIESSANLIAKLCKDYNIPCNDKFIIGHNQINSINRNNCPGNGVDLPSLINKAKNILLEESMIEDLKRQIKELNQLIQDQKVEINNLIKQLSLTESQQVKSLLNENDKLRKEILKLQNQLNNRTKSNNFFESLVKIFRN